jgi:hypothetical protein
MPASMKQVGGIQTPECRDMPSAALMASRIGFLVAQAFDGSLRSVGAHTSIPYVMHGLMNDADGTWSFVAVSRWGFLRTCFHEWNAARPLFTAA